MRAPRPDSDEPAGARHDHARRRRQALRCRSPINCAGACRPGGRSWTLQLASAPRTAAHFKKLPDCQLAAEVPAAARSAAGTGTVCRCHPRAAAHGWQAGSWGPPQHLSLAAGPCRLYAAATGDAHAAGASCSAHGRPVRALPPFPRVGPSAWRFKKSHGPGCLITSVLIRAPSVTKLCSRTLSRTRSGIFS